MDTYTQTFLQDRDLDEFESVLVKNGVKSLDDLALLTEEDLTKMGMGVLHLRKLQKGIEDELTSKNEAGTDVSPKVLRAAQSMESWDSVSATSQEQGKKPRKSFTSFSLFWRGGGNKKADFETASSGSGDKASTASGDSSGLRRPSIAAPITGGSALGGGYNNGGQLPETRHEAYADYALSMNLSRNQRWDFERSIEGSQNHMAVLYMGNEMVKWNRAVRSAYGGSAQNLAQGSKYYSTTHKVLTPGGVEVEVPAVRATTRVHGSVEEVMGILLMADSATLLKRMSILDGTFLHGQVLRVVSPRSAGGHEPAYAYPSATLCTVTRTCHQFPDQKSPRDFVLRNYYGFHDDGGTMVGVRAMTSIDEHVQEAEPRPTRSGRDPPVRGRVFEGSGFVVRPYHTNTCEVSFTMIATLSSSDSSGRTNRRRSKGTSQAMQLEAAASIVDSIRVFVDRQRSLRGEAWCKGDIQPAQGGVVDPEADKIKNSSAKARNKLLGEEGAQKLAGAASGSLAMSAAPVAPADPPPLPPPRTDKSSAQMGDGGAAAPAADDNDGNDDDVPALDPLPSPRVVAPVAPIDGPDQDDDAQGGAGSEAAEDSGRNTPEDSNAAMQLMAKELAETKRRLQEVEQKSKAEKDKYTRELKLRMESRRRLEEESRPWGTMPLPGKGGETPAIDAAMYAEMERLRNRIKKMKAYVPPNINEDDLDLTLEEAERRMRDAVQRIMSTEDEKEQFEAQNQFEKYDEIVRNHPEYKERELEKWRKWEEEQRPKNEAALEEMKKVIKPEYFKMSKDQLITKENLKPQLAARIHTQKVLQLLYLTPEEIAKIHYGDFTNKYNPQGLDIVEQRAIYAASPEEFGNDPTGDKAKWRVNVKEKLSELVKKEEKNALRGDEKRNRAYLADVPKPAGAQGGAPRGLPAGPRVGGRGGGGRGNPLESLFAGRGAGGPRGPPRGPPGGNPVAALFAGRGADGPRGAPRGPPGGNPVAALFAGRGAGGPRGPPGAGGADGAPVNPVAALFAGRGAGGPRGPPGGGSSDDAPANPVAALFAGRGAGGPRGPPASGGVAGRGKALEALFAGRGAGGPPRAPPRSLSPGSEASDASTPKLDDSSLAGAAMTTSQRKLVKVTDDDITKSLERSFSSKLSLGGESEGAESESSEAAQAAAPVAPATKPAAAAAAAAPTSAETPPAAPAPTESPVAPAPTEPPVAPAPTEPPVAPADVPDASAAAPVVPAKSPAVLAATPVASKAETAQVSAPAAAKSAAPTMPAAGGGSTSRPSLSPKPSDDDNDEMLKMIHASFRANSPANTTNGSAGPGPNGNAAPPPPPPRTDRAATPPAAPPKAFAAAKPAEAKKAPDDDWMASLQDSLSASFSIKK